MIDRTMHYPKTIDDMAKVLEFLRNKYGRLDSIPYEDAVIPTHEFFDDLCQRILKLEQKETNKND